MKPRSEITAFTGLRGLAAWWVVLYHFSDFVPVGGAAMRFIRHGPLAVDLFFVMSGFVLALSYGDSFARRLGARSWASFMVMRLGRIYPLHLAILLMYVTVPLALWLTGRPIADERFPITYFAQSLILIQNWGLASGLAWNPPAWSISAELLFYIVFPFIAFAFGRWSEQRVPLLVMGGTSLVCITALGVSWGSLEIDPPRFGTVRCIAECILGVWLFYAVRLWQPGYRTAIALLLLSSGLGAMFALGIAEDYTVIPAAYMCLIAGLTNARNAVSRILSSSPLQFLGTISFSTYLIHYLIKDWIKLIFAGQIPSPWLFTIYITAVFASSVILYRLVEAPGRRAGRHLAGLVREPAELLAPPKPRQPA